MVRRDKQKILQKRREAETQQHPGLVSLGKRVRSDQGGKTKWIMRTGKISWSDKLIVLPFSTVCPVPQDTNKGKPEVLH